MRIAARTLGGDLTLESALGIGAMFSLWLPATDLPDLPDAASRGGEREPDPASARSTRETLTRTAITARAPHGLAEIGHWLHEDLQGMLDAWTVRLRADGEYPDADTLPAAELEDFTLAFLAQVVQALVVIEQTGLESDLLVDGTAMLRATSERDGRQRLRLGWTEAQLAREYAVSTEEVVGRVRRYVHSGSGDAALACGILARALADARDAATRAYRAGAGDSVGA